MTSLIEQVQGVNQGITDAREANNISASEAQQLHMRAAHISQAAQHVAASDHGRIPSAQYHELLRRLDNVDQRLMNDTGSGFMIGDGDDGGNYPNG
jgi:ABC-type oligopeptide transport system substrate-binding subunit